MPFGSYLLLKRLAVGGMAELFLARDTKTDRLVVLKRILPYLAEEAEFVRMFLDEARIAASLHHPNIVELFELGHLDGSTFIAMEWVDGIDLRRVLQKEQERGKAMPPGIAAWIVARLCEGLQHAHSARDQSGKALGIIHRDVSPQNVMLSFDADVKLVDFGIAKATAWMSRSKPGVIKGKFLYLAPEQLTTEPLDSRMDLFALGTLMYELTTGKSPFYRTSTEAVIYAIRMEDPEPPTKARKDFPPLLSKVIMRCLQKDRTRRYQTAGEVAAALEDFIRREAPTTLENVKHYVTTLFGDESERTSVYIPPNAQAKERARGFSKIDEERTVPIAPAAKPAPLSRLPEGRRETAEVKETRASRPASIRPPPPVRDQNPWEVELTAPMPKEPKPTAPSLASGEFPPTAVSESGARDVRVGEVFKRLAPTLMGDSSPQLTRAAPPSPPVAKEVVPLIRARALAARPGPPVPSEDSVPEVSAHSVVSAGEVTLGDSLRNLEPLEPDLPDPSPPRPSTRAPPRRVQATPIRRPAPRDPDDDVETVDRRQDFAMGGPTPLAGRKGVLILIGLVVLAVAVLLAVVFWPLSSPRTPVSVTDTEEKLKPPSTVKTHVTVRAPKGTVVMLDDKPMPADGAIDHEPGDVDFVYTCPPRKKTRGQQLTRRERIPEGTKEFVVELRCP